MEPHVLSLLIVATAAVLAPLLGELTERFGVPVVVLEILLGVAIGPQGLGWAQADAGAIPHLALFGVCFLFFLAGLEIDLLEIRHQLALAGVAWLAGLAIAGAAALALRSLGLVHAWTIVAIALATTALGVLLPILRDGDVLKTPLGRCILAAGAAGEIGPILARSVALSQQSAPVQMAFTVTFLAAAGVIGWVVVTANTPRVFRFLRTTMTRSSQLPIRLGVLLLVGLAVLAETFAVDLALGALAAGLIIGIATRNADVHVLRIKLDAIGFGFLVPVFFIVSGMRLDIATLARGSGGLLLAAAFVVTLLLVRVPLVLLHRRSLGGRLSVSLGLFSATTLSLIVALTTIAVQRGLMTAAEAAPLVAAGMISVVLFPGFGLRLAGGSRQSEPTTPRRI